MDVSEHIEAAEQWARKAANGRDTAIVDALLAIAKTMQADVGTCEDILTLWAGMQFSRTNCVLRAGHLGLHRDAKGQEWSSMLSQKPGPAIELHDLGQLDPVLIQGEPEPSAVERLHKLVRYLQDQSHSEIRHVAAGKAYTDAAERLEALLREVGL